MRRPIETLLSIRRVRLFDRVPIFETERLVRLFANRINYQRKLVKDATAVSEGSARQFSEDDRGLSTLIEELESREYVVTKRSRRIMEEMLSGMYGDGLIFKDFETEIEPLYPLSSDLRRASQLADQLADKTKEETFDVARALLIDLPKRNPDQTSD